MSGYIMGITESAIKTMTEPLNTLIGNCGHSDCKTRCCDCFELEIDTMQQVTAHPVLVMQPREDTHDSIISNVTLIVEPINT